MSGILAGGNQHLRPRDPGLRPRVRAGVEGDLLARGHGEGTDY